MNQSINYPALIISILALLFTVFSFWWMNWRTGKLIIAPPRSFAAIGSREHMIIEIPLVFFNTGPMPIVIQNMRLFLPDYKLHLSFMATVAKLSQEEGRVFATQFPVRGRESVLMICEFHASGNRISFEAKKYRIELQGFYHKKKEWDTLLCFQLNVPINALPTINQQFIAYDNMLDE
ncbi:MAG: hypothetical protein JXA73_08735 [Acidobacteria bacterium]|nr:hypothetical protein [Acidobacteriota bacterium]